jgi:hypothetical protein
MKKVLIAALLLSGVAPAQEPCLAVYPVRGTGTSVAAAGVFAPFLYRADHYNYLESVALPLKQTKVSYSKRELEKLEKSGVKVVVTTKESVKVNAQEQRAGANRDNRDTSVSATAKASAGCQ